MHVTTTTIFIVASLLALIVLVYFVVSFRKRKQANGEWMRAKRIIEGIPHIKDPRLRLKAINELAALDTDTAHKQLTHYLRDTNPNIRQLALNTLLAEVQEVLPLIKEVKRWEATKLRPNSIIHIYLQGKKRALLYERDNFIVKGLIQALIELARVSEKPYFQHCGNLAPHQRFQR